MIYSQQIRFHNLRSSADHFIATDDLQLNTVSEALHNASTSSVGNVASTKVPDRKDLKQICAGIDGAALLLLMSAAVSAMVAGWIGALQNMNRSRMAFAAFLALGFIGMAGTIEATVVINSVIGR